MNIKRLFYQLFRESKEAKELRLKTEYQIRELENLNVRINMFLVGGLVSSEEKEDLENKISQNTARINELKSRLLH